MRPDFNRHLLVRIARWFAQRIDSIEAILYASFTMTVFLAGGFGAVIAGANLVLGWRQLAVPERVGAAAWVVGWVFLDMPCMFRLALNAVRHQSHIALKTAEAQRMTPFFLRPLVTIWWAAHFLAGAWMAALFHSFSHGQSFSQWLVLIPAIGLGICANGFLMLAICAATSSAHARSMVWRFRLLVDAAIGLIGVFFVHLILGK